jgi:hypothetical protein
VLQFFSGRAISRHLTPTVFGGLVHLAIWPATLLVALMVGGGVLRFLPGGAVAPLGYAFLAGLAGAHGRLSGADAVAALRPASTVAPVFNLNPW